MSGSGRTPGPSLCPSSPSMSRVARSSARRTRSSRSTPLSPRPFAPAGASPTRTPPSSMSTWHSCRCTRPTRAPQTVEHAMEGASERLSDRLRRSAHPGRQLTRYRNWISGLLDTPVFGWRRHFMKGGSCGSCGRRSAQRNAGRRSSWVAGCGEPSTVSAAQPVGSPEPRLVRSPTSHPPLRSSGDGTRFWAVSICLTAPPEGTRDCWCRVQLGTAGVDAGQRGQERVDLRQSGDLGFEGWTAAGERCHRRRRRIHIDDLDLVVNVAQPADSKDPTFAAAGVPRVPRSPIAWSR